MACNRNRAQKYSLHVSSQQSMQFYRKLHLPILLPNFSKKTYQCRDPLLPPRLQLAGQKSAALARTITVRRCLLFTSLNPQRVGLNLVKKLLPSNSVLDRRHHEKTYTTAWTFNTMGHSGQHKNLMSEIC